GALGDRRASEPLMEILKEDDYILRACTVTSLGKIGDNLSLQSLIRSLEDENYLVRVNAAHALGTIGDKAALPYLQEALNKSRGESQEFERAIRDAMAQINTRS
ncbi:MAG TPA: HEAT repeat domain-containing protein, partial [Methanobacteriaceae archaeon]|nr:HEAT repeat domain-containing protein [Methanobacteriaceae archaeon]